MMELELEDIQALILSGHAHLAHSCYLLLRVTDAARAKQWLRTILGDVTSARRRARQEAKPPTALHVGFSSQGFKKLGIPNNSLGTFSLEFQEGLADPERSRILGDTGESAPPKWVWGGSPDSEVHAVLMLYARDEPTLKTFCAQQRRRFQEGRGLQEVACEESVVAKDHKEPFGFLDGIAQPTVEGGLYKETPGEPPIRAGEFVLGYPNEYGTLPYTPTVPRSLDQAGVLPAVPGDPTRRDLGRNGSYLVFRRLAQDVPGFWKYLEEQAQKLYGTRNHATVTRLAAKCVGRWPSGAPLVLSPEKDDPALGSDSRRNDNFQYGATDPYGFACPIGAHIRRANPRDTLSDNPQEAVKLARRHRIIRRGRPYRRLDAANPAVSEQGIFFIAINANLRRQFEFIQQTWVNNPKFGGLYEDKDPLLGDNDDTSNITIPGHPVRERLEGAPRFVQVRAGGYFFLPGIRALSFLASLP